MKSTKDCEDSLRATAFEPAKGVLGETIFLEIIVKIYRETINFSLVSVSHVQSKTKFLVTSPLKPLIILHSSLYAHYGNVSVTDGN
jgi:hypothetical protein